MTLPPFPALWRACLLCAAGVQQASAAHAHLQPLSEDELSNTRGQGLVDLSNTSLGGYDFSKVTLDADITLSANLRNVRLGEYTYAARNGTGADLDISALQFGRSDGTDAQRVVKISNPYFEFVYRNAGDGAAREVIGMRFGFEAISGDVGLKINTLSGSMLVNGTAADGSAVQLDSRTDALGGKRWDGACAAGAACLTLAQLGGVTAGDASGPSRDFWVSLLKSNVQFPAASGTAALPDVAQAGVWLNWRDKLQALSTNGVMPANLAKAR
jgi:hypothetical protein